MLAQLWACLLMNWMGMLLYLQSCLDIIKNLLQWKKIDYNRMLTLRKVSQPRDCTMLFVFHTNVMHSKNSENWLILASNMLYIHFMGSFQSSQSVLLHKTCLEVWKIHSMVFSQSSIIAFARWREWSEEGSSRHNKRPGNEGKAVGLLRPLHFYSAVSPSKSTQLHVVFSC